MNTSTNAGRTLTRNQNRTKQEMITLGLSMPTTKTEKRSENGFSLPVPGNWQSVFGFGTNSDAGEIITPQNSMQVSTVWACVRILAESLGSLPCKLYSRTANGRQEAISHPVYKLLRDSPSDEQTAVSFWELMTTWVCLHGNAYAQIQRSGANGSPVAFWPLRPELTNPVRLPDGSIGYRTTDGDGVARLLKGKDVLHFLGISICGLIGLSPIHAARQSIGLARAAERYGSTLFKSSAVPALAITTTAKVKAEDKAKMRADWETLQTGSSQHRVAILDADMKIEKLGISAEDSQFLETRNYQRADIAAIFRIAPHLVGDTQKISNANLVQENLQLVTQTLRPWLSRFESELRRKVLSTLAGNYDVEFDTTELTRGDSVAESAAFTAGVQGGWLSPAEVRHALNLNPGPECLNAYRVPVNYQNAETLLDTQSIQDEPVGPDSGLAPADSNEGQKDE
ncbi:HK97 family phage portal protein [Edaphobacter aggregans]|uniref:HK97 family phage portal protein n=2 Tax=Edaphobacter aggregans TaxID=570835 RepID=A0A3R9NWW9_9BACT|nr:HK97 family phage portal protein [Edaphobacter aggregans]